MITIVRHEDNPLKPMPSYFYITADSELSSLPACCIDSKALNLNTKDLWILCCANATTRCWHKYGTNQEVQC